MSVIYEIITVRQAAARLGVSPRTVYRWIEEGKLSACVIRLPSGRIRIEFKTLLEELEDYSELFEDRRRRKTGREE